MKFIIIELGTLCVVHRIFEKLCLAVTVFYLANLSPDTTFHHYRAIFNHINEPLFEYETQKVLILVLDWLTRRGAIVFH